MLHFLSQIEGSSFCSWVRDSPSVWAYPTVLLLHTIGMTLVVAISAGIGLRVLGFAPALPIAPMEKFFPILWTGFWMNVATGLVLLAIDATMKLTNPDFYVKMLFVALGVTFARMLQNRLYHKPPGEKTGLFANTKFLAAASLIFWIGAMTCGRLLAYVGPGSGT
jgi:hypothetical protein